MAMDRSALEAELRQLKGRVAQLEELLHASAPPTSVPEPPPPPAVPIQEYDRWIDQHVELLRQHADCFIAIDPTLGDQGLVIHEANGDAFNEQLDELYKSDPTARERVLLSHASMY